MGTWTTTTRVSDYDGKLHLSCPDTAKLVRAALKRAFPGQKFSVRSDHYSGGASINVAWEDGPTTTDVEKVIGMFHGADFDGMIDLKTHNDHWLQPDGTVTLAKRQGTTGSFVEGIYDPPSPGSRLVSLGADYIRCTRRESAALEARADEIFEAIYGEPCDGNKMYAVRFDDRFPTLSVTGEEYGSTLKWRIARTLTG